ncbi:MAG: glycosyltransferase [Solirubrobacterales bacterium]
MRIALVSPYSWTYRGGVNGHIQALAEEFIARGHYVRVIAPVDPPDRFSRFLHRTPAEEVELPDYLIPVGRTVGIGSNGSISNISVFPESARATRRAIEEGNFDVVHLHEPITPVNGWDTCLSSDVPVVGTFHAYATKPVPHRLAAMAGVHRVLNRLSARIAVSEAAAWTGRRWYGGNFTIIPNGVNIDAAPTGQKAETDHLRVLFVGRTEDRKGLPVLLRAFEGLVEHDVPARLAVVGSDAGDVQRLVAHTDIERHLDLHGRVSGPELWQHLHQADLLCAPSLSGESFGMVLTEAFAAGTPVIASDIAGYRDVVTNWHDGVLVPAADPQRLAEELQRAHQEPERLNRMGRAARESARRFAWPTIADDVTEVYERAIEIPAATNAGDRIRRRIGVAPNDGLPRQRAERLASIDPVSAVGPTRFRRLRKVALGLVGLIGVGMTLLAAQKIGVDRVAGAMVRSDLSWVFIALGLMAFSLFVRAQSWFYITKAAMPGIKLRRKDFASATMIGVLMSATLPARLGEPARALALSRHTGKAKDSLPVVVGTLVSQTMFNLFALLLLGLIIVASTDLFHNSTKTIFTFSLIPLALLLAVIILPSILRKQGDSRLGKLGRAIHSALVEVRSGLAIFKQPRLGIPALLLQTSAWGIQLLSCWALMFALGLEAEAGLGASAAVLFAVNVTAVVPATPSNVGIFQLAVISVLTTGWGVSASDALAYGVILQAVEIATAVGLGVPALFREGLTWSDLRLQAIATAPVELGSKAPRREQRDSLPDLFR